MENPHWKAYVENCISLYPTLYAKANEEDSEFSVAHHTWIVLGNGMEWGTFDGEKFVLGHNHNVKIKEEWYTAGFSVLRGNNWEASDFIGKQIWVWTNVRDCEPEEPANQLRDKWFKFEQPENWIDYDNASQEEVLAHMKGMAEGTAGDWLVYDFGECKKREKPYPNFQVKYSHVWKIESYIMEPSWREAALTHHEYWFDYHNVDSHEGLELHVATADEYLKRWDEHSVEHVQKEWDVPVWNGNNVDEAVDYLRRKQHMERKVFLENTISKLKG